MITPSRTLFYFCIAFIAGVGLSSLAEIPPAIMWGFLIGGFFLVIISFFPYAEHLDAIGRLGWLLGFCFLFLVLGAARVQIVGFAMQKDPLSRFIDSPEKITLTGTIIEEPDVRDTSQKIIVQIKNTKGRVLVTVQRYPEYHYKDILKLTGLILTPPEFEDFNYANYLKKDGIYSVMSFPKIEKIAEKKTGNALEFAYSKIIDFKLALKESINRNFTLPESAIVEGLILGSDKNMPSQTRQQLNITGLSHLTALSGSNIVMLSNVMMALLLFIGLWRQQAFYGAIAFVWLYVTIAAFPSSGVRAAIVATVMLLAQRIGRAHASSRALVFTAALMLFYNPLLLRYDIGFQLSFLASLGIVTVVPIANAYSQRLANKQFKKAVDIFVITLAAYIFTAPVIAFHFQSISLVALITNLLIIPVVNIIMIIGFLSAFLGIFSEAFGFLLSLPASVLLIYFLKVLDIFGKQWAMVSLQTISLLPMAPYYLALLGLVRFLQKRTQFKFLGA